MHVPPHGRLGDRERIGHLAARTPIELDQFANAQTVQELQSLITPDAHGNAVIDFGHHDSVTLTGVTTPELQQAIQAGHVLLH